MSTSAKKSVQTAKSIQNRSRLVPFLRKLQLLCENAPSHVARWSADGKQFDVLDPKGFEELLKVYFEGAAPATFHRQLFFYGWVKLNPSNGGGDEKTKGTFSFRHPCFLRDEPSKIYEIKRYARASERDEEEDGSRVDVLERRVSALQSVVDDLSRKLAAVQVTLERSPLPVEVSPGESLMGISDVASSGDEEIKAFPGRKRVRDLDEESLDDVRLSEQDIMELFEANKDTLVQEPLVEDADRMEEVSEESKASEAKPVAVSDDTTKFLSMCLSTPEFRAAINATAASTKLQEQKPADKPLSNSRQLEVF